MANQRGGAIPLDTTGYNPQGASGGGLPGLPSIDLTRAADARERVYTQLSGQVGQWADQMAADEGRRAGKAAGLDPNYTPSNTPTIRGRAYDAAATATYLSGVQSNYQRDALDLFDKHRSDPAGLAQALDGLKSTYESRHVFPEIVSDFRQLADQTALHYRKAALNAFDADRKEVMRAGAIRDMATRSDAMARVLATDPSSPEAEALARRNEAADEATIRAQVQAGALAADRAEQMILDRKARTHAEIIAARAQTLATQDDVEAYRRKVKADFVGGKYPGLDHAGVDAALVKVGRVRAVEADHALKELNAAASDFLDRQAKGLPPPASEWLALEERAKKAGAQGIASLDATRMKLRLRTQIESLPVPDAEKVLSGLENSARQAPTGSGLERQAMQFFLGRGYSRAQAAGIVGNLVQESGLNVHATNAGDGRDGSDSIGVGQWNDDRARGLRAFAAARGASPTDFETQLAFIDHELNNGEAGAGARLRRATTADEAAAAMIGYERPRGWSLADPTAGHGWENRVGHARRLSGPGGVDATSAGVLEDARAALERKRQMIAADPLLAAQREGLLATAPPLEFDKGGETVAQQLPARMAAADAVAGAYKRAPQYIRPDERDAMKATLQKGGDAALDLVSGVLRGAGDKAPRVLAEVGGEAPALAHAGMVMLSTGDRAFARQVAEAQKAAAVDDAKLPRPNEKDVSTIWREAMGSALHGLSADETQRTQAAALQWARVEMWRRGVDPGKDVSQTKDILKEAVQRARGMTGSGDKTYGGLADVSYGAGGWFSRHAQSARVQVPADVRTGRFGDVLDALRDEDFAGLAAPPVERSGRPLSATEMRRLQPVFTPGGYEFVRVDPVTGQMTPAMDAAGKPFRLDWKSIAPRLRERVPEAFR